MSETETKKQNDRGILGTGTPGRRLKNLHASMGRGLTLKQFVRDQLKIGNPDAKEWVANKRGKNNAKRSPTNMTRVALERAATKMSRKSTKKSGGTSPTLG